MGKSHKEKSKELWENKFILLNGRKSSRLEKLSWTAGWNMASDSYEKIFNEPNPIEEHWQCRICSCSHKYYEEAFKCCQGK